MRPSCVYQVPEEDQGHDDVLFVRGQQDCVRGAATSSVLRTRASQDAPVGSRLQRVLGQSRDYQAEMQLSCTGSSRGLVTDLDSTTADKS